MATCALGRTHSGISPPQRAATRRAAARPVVQAAAAAGPPGSGANGGRGTSGRRGARQRQLVQLLLEQAAKEAWGGWLGDLVMPLVSDDPGSAAPPPATVPPRQLADPDSQFIQVDGVELHYKEALPTEVTAAAAGGGVPAAPATGSNGSSIGSGPAAGLPQQEQQGQQWRERPAVLLVHGLNGSTFNWRATMQPLADVTGCRVIAFDRPPFGLAQRPLSWGQPGQALQYNPYSQEGSARLAEGLLDALGVGPVVAVGHSAGAIVCMELAQRQPQRVAALGFVAPALPTTPENSWQRKATLGAQLRFLLIRQLLADDVLGLRYVRRQILRRRDEVAAGDIRLHSEDFERPQDVIDGYLRPLRAADWDRASLLNFRTFSLPPSYDYASLHQPVLLVQGSEDGGLTQNARVLSNLLRQRPTGETCFVELEGVGHVPMDECPGELNGLLVDFVRQVVGGSSADQQAAWQAVEAQNSLPRAARGEAVGAART